MNILLINHYAGTPDLGMEFRPYYLAKEWVKLGHNVTIIASSFSHLRKEAIIDKGFYKKENIEGINYIWLKTPSYKKNDFKRIINIITFLFNLYRIKKYIIKNFKQDIIIASSTYPFDIFFAKRLSNLCSAKLIFEIHDLWPLSPKELGGYSKYHPFIIACQYAEDFACKNCDRTVSILPDTKEYLISRGLKPDKFCHIPNGIIITTNGQEKKNLPENYKNFLEKLKKEDNFLIGYTGAHGIANSLTTLVNAAYILKDKKAHFVLVGSGQEKINLINKTKSLRLNNVHFLDTVPKEAVQDLMKYFDALYIGWQNRKLYRFGISPNKIMDYMLSEKPIIHSVSIFNDIVKILNCGISVEAENSVAVADAVIDLMSMPKKEREKLGERGRKYVIENHDYKILAENFLEII